MIYYITIYILTYYTHMTMFPAESRAHTAQADISLGLYTGLAPHLANSQHLYLLG